MSFRAAARATWSNRQLSPLNVPCHPFHLGLKGKNRLPFSAGATLATVLSLMASLAFSFYVDDLGRASTYNKFYGSIATIIILMLWIQFNSLIILIGYELNASIAVNRDLKEQIKEQESID